MYKLVIVEDEHDVRQRMIALVEKSGSRFDIVGEYENGIDAYEGIQSDAPDLVITDIRIPYINGIELAGKVRQVLPMVKFIIVTGYNEFDYAKQAANLGVLGFVSKPVTLEDVVAQLEKAQAVLDSEYLTAASLGQLKAFYESGLPIVRENYLYRLSKLSEVPPSFDKKLKYNNIDLDFVYFAMCVLDFDENTEADPERYELAFSSVRRLVGESFLGLCEVEQFGRYESLCLILKSNRPLDLSAIEAQLQRLVLRVGSHSGMPMSAGMSRVHEGSRNFSAMLKEAIRALEYRSVMGGGRVFLLGDVLPAAAAPPTVDESEVRQLCYLLRYKTQKDFRDALLTIQEKLDRPGSQNAYRYILTSTLNELVRACDDLDGLYSRFDGQDGVYRRVFEAKTADEAFAFFDELAGAIRQLNDGIIVDSVERNLQKVLDYIQANYCEGGINLETLAAEVNLSVSYISALLRKNLNTSFVKYLTALRMERARELLQNPALKIFDIAEQLGYSDPYYFSHCFKKYTGVSPKEYRSHEYPEKVLSL